MIGLGSLLGGAAALGSSIYGAIASSNRNKRVRAILQGQRADNRRWYENQMASDYTMRIDAQDMLRRQRELLSEQLQQARAINKVAGGTDASLALQQQMSADSLANTMSNLAAQSSAYRDSVENRYMAQDASLSQQQAQLELNQAQAAAQAAAQAVDAGINLMDQGLRKKKV